MITRNNNLLRVLPNPYIQLDGFANPAGILPVDPQHNPDRYYVGAEIAKVEILDTLEKGDLRNPRQDTYWKFNLEEPTLLPITTYYVDALRSGYLFAADEETAKKAGVVYQDKHVCLAKACAEARQKWKDMYGEECALPQYEIPVTEKKLVDAKK